MGPDRAGPAGYRFGKPEHRAVLMGLRPVQVAVIAVGVLAAVAVLTAVPSGAGIVAALGLLAATGALAAGRVRGRPLDEWLPVLARHGLMRASARRVWTSPAPRVGNEPGADPVPVPPPPLHGVTLLRVRCRGSETAVVRDARAGSYTAVLSCEGRTFALLDASEQERLVTLFGDVLAAFAHEGSPVERVGWVERTVPEDGDALGSYLESAAVLDESHPARASYAELVAQAGPATRRHETYVSLTIGSERGGRLVRQAGGGDEGACTVLLRELAVLADRLVQAEIDVAGALSPDHLAGIVRTAFDPAVLRPLARRARRNMGDTGVTSASAWPVATSTAWDHYRTDSGFHTTYWVAEWPRRHVPASFLHPLLLRPESAHAVAVVMDPVPPSRAVRAVESAHAAHLADEELRTKAGYLPTARRDREHETILARERELAEGHAEYRFSGYVTVSARSHGELEAAAGETEQLGFDAQVELRRLYGEQDRAFTYTLPFGRGLD